MQFPSIPYPLPTFQIRYCGILCIIKRCRQALRKHSHFLNKRINYFKPSNCFYEENATQLFPLPFRGSGCHFKQIITNINAGNSPCLLIVQAAVQTGTCVKRTSLTELDVTKEPRFQGSYFDCSPKSTAT